MVAVDVADTKRNHPTILTATVSLILLAVAVHNGLIILSDGMRGKEVTIEQHPYFAFLEIGDIRCGAVIVDSWYGMTTAKCVKKWEDISVQIHVGNSEQTSAEVQDVFKVCIPSAHEGQSNDFSLLRFSNKLEFGDKVGKPIWYNETGHHNAKWWKSASCIALGGGVYNEEGARSSLRKSRVKLFECSDDTSIACYKHIDKNDTTCADDEGGPILCQRSRQGNKEFELVAIVSNSSEVCEPNRDTDRSEWPTFSASWLPTFLNSSLFDCIKYLETASRLGRAGEEYEYSKCGRL